MAIAFRDSATTDITVATASPEVTKPAGTQEGDLIIVFGFTFDPKTFTAPAGWTEIQNEQTTSGGGNLGVIYKIAGASEPSTWTLTSLLSGADVAAFGAIAYSGVNQASPIHASAAIGDVSSSTTLSGPEITTTVGNCMIVQIIGADLEATGSADADDSPAGTQRVEFNGAGGVFCFVWAQDYLQPSAGAISLDARNLSESDTWAHFQIALNPAAGAPAAPATGYKRLYGPAQLPSSAADLFLSGAQGETFLEDDFDRADGDIDADLTSEYGWPWMSPMHATDSVLRVGTNRLVANTAANRYSGGVIDYDYGKDVRVEVKVITVGGAGEYVFLSTRIPYRAKGYSFGTGSNYCRVAFLNDDGGPNIYVQFDRYINGSGTTLRSGYVAGGNLSANDELAFETYEEGQGTRYRAYHKASGSSTWRLLSEVLDTAATRPNAKRVAIELVGPSAGNPSTYVLDDLRVGAIPSARARVRHLHLSNPSALDVGVTLGISRVYADEVLQDRPAAYWRMDEPSGLPLDSSGNGQHVASAEGAGSASYSQTGALASGNTAIKLNPNYRFTVNDSTYLDLGDVLTVELWLKIGAAPATYSELISKQANAYELRLNSARTITFIKASVGGDVTSTQAVPNDGNFHHIVATKDGSTMALYIDGVDVTGSYTPNTWENNTSALHIGQDANDYLNGTLDEVAIYPTALSAERVRAHYEAAFERRILDAWPLTAGRVHSTRRDADYTLQAGEAIQGFAVPLEFPSTSLLDNFTRADESPLAGNWSTPIQSGGASMALTSNAVNSDNTPPANPSAYWDIATFVDCEAWVTFSADWDATEYVQVLARIQNPGAAAVDAYRVSLADDGLLSLQRVDDGVNTQLTTVDIGTPGAGDSIGLRCVGDRLEAWYKPSGGSWSLQLTTTDTTYPGAGYIGMAMFTTDLTSTLDDFGGGAVATSVVCTIDGFLETA